MDRRAVPVPGRPGAGLVAKAVRELAAPILADARAAVAAGRLSVPASCVVAAEWRQLEPLIEPDAGEAVLAGLITMGVVDGSAGVRRLRPALLSRYGLGEVLQEVETGTPAADDPDPPPQ
jgi:hypothetical protein